MEVSVSPLEPSPAMSGRYLRRRVTLVVVLALLGALTPASTALGVTKSQVDRACSSSAGAHDAYLAARSDFHAAAEAYEVASIEVENVLYRQERAAETLDIRQTDMQEALNKSVEELPAEDRLLVKLYYFDNLRLREAGAVLGVHEATASRRLTRIQSDLRKRVTKILIDERGWTQAETERSFAEVAQHLDTDLEALLSKEGVS